MNVTSSGIINGIIADRFGKRGVCNEYGMPTCSLPLTIEDAPQNTVSYAIFLEDKDAFPVSGGFSWVHWTAANITVPVLEENASQLNPDFVQGANSWMSSLGGSVPVDVCSCYGGMAPPNAPHVYEIHVYALDTMLDLSNGFFLNDMFAQMRGHILAQTTLLGEYSHE